MRSFLLFCVLFLCFQEARPDITVAVEPVEPNQVGIIRVTIANPSTAELLWGSVLRIEEAHPYIVPVKAEYDMASKIKPGEVDIGELTFQVAREAPAGEYPVTISLSGGVGACEEGCVPYFIEKEATIKVVRDQPDIVVAYTVQDTHIVVTLTNKGSGKAQNVTCGQVGVGTISPGAQKEVTLEKTSTFAVTYEDDYGKKFSQSYRITESKPEPDNDASLQSGLIVLGMVFAYLFKRGTN